VPSPETEAHIEGAINLWRFKGRGALAIVAIVGGLWVFAHVDAASDPGPTDTPTHHVHTSGDSNGAPPVFGQP
jgi:hypothetical protein